MGRVRTDILLGLCVAWSLVATAAAQVGPAIHDPSLDSASAGSLADPRDHAASQQRVDAAEHNAVFSESRPLGVPRAPRRDAAPAHRAPAESAPLAGEPKQGVLDRSAWSSLGPLALVVTLIVLLAALARRFARGRGGLVMAMGAGGRAPSGVVEVLARYPTGRGSSIVLMRVDRRVLVLHQASTRRDGTRMSVLSELSNPEDVASMLVKTRDEAGESIARSFDRLLGRESSRHEFADAQLVSDARTDRRHTPRTGVTSSAPAPRQSTDRDASGGAAAVRRRLEQMRSGGVLVRAWFRAAKSCVPWPVVVSSLAADTHFTSRFLILPRRCSRSVRMAARCSGRLSRA